MLAPVRAPCNVNGHRQWRDYCLAVAAVLIRGAGLCEEPRNVRGALASASASIENARKWEALAKRLERRGKEASRG